MPKRKRVWYPGAVYHIMSRGNRRSKIFRDDSDYRVYLKILDKTCFDYKFQLYGYCIMPNHIHLQLETGETEIWEIMRRINRGYACYFNRRHNLVGHLFQGRYKSKLIQDPHYNLQVNRYIHLNPVKAGLVERPGDYLWSSYSFYLGYERSEIVNPDRILRYFWPDNRQGSASPAGPAGSAGSAGPIGEPGVPAAGEGEAGSAGEIAAGGGPEDGRSDEALAPVQELTASSAGAGDGGRGMRHFSASAGRGLANLKLARKAYQQYIESEPPADEAGIDQQIEKELV